MERVTMPQLGETVTEGTITRWLKQVGDAVAEDEVLFEVSTDKVDTEVPSAHAGVVRAILVAEGATVPVGTPLAVLTATADEPFEGAGEPVAAALPPPVAALAAPPGGRLPPAVPPPSGPGGAPGGGGPQRAPRPPGVPARGGSGFLSPVVRRLLADHGLAPADVVGSGEGGRITRADVLAAAANRSVTPGAAAPQPSPAGLEPYPPPAPGPGDTVVELTRARRVTAEHMVRSQRTSAHTLVGTQVDYVHVDAVRRAAGLSYLPFVARAVVDALRHFPHLNASVGEDALLVHPAVHLGIAVDVDFEALVVPVVKHADGLRLRSIHDAVADLAARARAKRLGADDLTGGTFTITNVGQYGTVVTFPVINQPQVAILSTDGVRMTPVAVKAATGDWTVAVHPVGNLSLGFDHRAVDGAYAAAFLAHVRDELEQRDWAEEL